MSAQRKLNALLFELQTARNPLAQAKILARAWRTLRELSPTDRKLLARHVGFDGAEEMLEGLATRGGGWAPAMLLKILSNARNTDGSSVSNLIDAIGDPDRREEALSMGADLAADLLGEPELEVEEGTEDSTEDAADVAEEIPVPAGEADPSPEEALAALRAVEEESGVVEAEGDGEEDVFAVEDDQALAEPLAEIEYEGETEPTPEPPPPPPVVDWSRWNQPAVSPQPALSAQAAAALVVDFRPAGEGEGGASVLDRLRQLHADLPRLEGSNQDFLRTLLDDFPQGWVRRRALAALLEAGIPRDPREAVELVATLQRPPDRRWCLGVLAHRGDLAGEALERAVDLLASPAAKRRLLATAEG